MVPQQAIGARVVVAAVAAAAVVVTVTVVPVVVAVLVVLVLVLVAVDTKSTVIQLFDTKSSRTPNHMFLPVCGSTVSSHCLCHGMRRASVLREQGLVQCVRPSSCLSQNGYGDR